MNKEQLLEKFYLVEDRDEIDIAKLKAGQTIWLPDDTLAILIQNRPNLLRHVGCIGELLKDGKNYTANWVEIVFYEGMERAIYTIPITWLKIVFKY